MILLIDLFSVSSKSFIHHSTLSLQSSLDWAHWALMITGRQSTDPLGPSSWLPLAQPSRLLGFLRFRWIELDSLISSSSPDCGDHTLVFLFSLSLSPRVWWEPSRNLISFLLLIPSSKPTSPLLLHDHPSISLLLLILLLSSSPPSPCLR